MLQLGISAPQGCGKTTIVEQLQQLCTWLGTRVASVSIDDFYLRRADQAELAAANPDNRLLQVRGNAGGRGGGGGHGRLGGRGRGNCRLGNAGGRGGGEGGGAGGASGN